MPDATPNDLTDNPRVKTEYDAAGEITAQIDERGNRSTFTYDLAGRRTSVTDALGHTSSYAYNNANYRISETDALGRSTTYLYDKVGRPAKVTYADGTSTSETYDSNGRRNSSTDQAGNTTRYVYNALNQPIEVIYADNTPNDLSDNPRSRTEYNELGQVVAQIDELGNRQEYEYDAAGRRIESRSDCACRRMTYAYDVAGKLTSQTDQLGRVTHFEYDNMDRLIKTIYADNTTTTTNYDALGREIAKADQNGKITQYEYDAQGRLSAVIDALNQRTEYGYDLASNLISMKDASNHITTYQYDSLNRRINTVIPMGQQTRATYDAVGNMTSSTNANGEVITYEYDALNRLKKKILPDETFTMSYAAIGKLASVTDSRGTTTYSYDVRQRLTEEKEPDGQFLRYGYNAANLRTSITTASGTTNFTYDKYKELQSVTDPNGAVTTYNYDKAGNLIETDLPNGVIETRTYDLLNHLTQTVSKKDSTVLFSAAYTLDNVGMRTKVVENLAGNSRTVNYTYDALYRLLSESDGSSTTGYTYSPTGNRLTKTTGANTANYVYDANDRLLTDGTATFTYDNNGNKKTETQAGVTTTYTWDAENRLKATQGGGSSTVYDYDYAGTRVSQSVNGIETRFLVDKNRNYAQVLEEYSPSGTILADYVYGSDLISQNRNGTKSFYVYDGLGSTRALTDASGAVTDSYTYDAYGNLSSSTGTTVNSYLYAGEQFDKNLGDYYLRDRYYSTDIGRFTQRDRFDGDMNMPLSLNRYGYTHGNPVNAIDPTGRFTEGEITVSEVIERDLATQQIPTWIPQVTRTLQQLGTNILNTAVQVVRSTIQTSYEIDKELKEIARFTQVPVIVWGVDLPTTTAHIAAAITGSGFTKDSVQDWEINGVQSTIFKATPLPVVLSKARPETPATGWYDSKQPCKSYKPSGWVCDEYPFKSTAQGGKTKYSEGLVSLFPIQPWEQGGFGSQGAYLTMFNAVSRGNLKDGGRGESAYLNPQSIFISFFTPTFLTYWIDRAGNDRSFWT